MAGAIGKYPIGHAKTELEIYDHLEAQPDGSVLVVYPDGKVRSVIPQTGAVETRPAGTAGAWEKACVNGGVITSYSDGRAWDFSLSQKVPNL